MVLKILDAMKTTSNNPEVDKYKKIRKRKNKRLKVDNIINSLSPPRSTYETPKHNQMSYQWLQNDGKLVSRGEEIKTTFNYNDLQQLNLQNLNYKNNLYNSQGIIDLRTPTPVSSNVSRNYEIGQSYNPLCDSNILSTLTENSSKSILLKKMLEAPVGANLEEIASPTFSNPNHYYSWPFETAFIQENSIDNSETLSAKSEINENDELWRYPTDPCFKEYELNNNNYQLNEQSTTRINENDETLALIAMNNHSNQFDSIRSNNEENFRSDWIVPNNLQNTFEYPDYNVNNSPTIYTNIQNFENSHSLNNQSVNYQQSGQLYYNEDTMLVDQNHNFFDRNQNLNEVIVESNPLHEKSANYFENEECNQALNLDRSDYSTFQNEINTNYTQEIESSNCNISNLLSQQSLFHQDSNCNQLSNITDNTIILRDDLDTYWPKWTNKPNRDVSLENMLNLNINNYVNYSKFQETCCVYTNKTPIMTLRIGFNSVPLDESWFSTETRQHSFISNSLLYTENNL